MFFRSPDIHKIQENPLYRSLLGSEDGSLCIESAREFCKVFSIWEGCNLEKCIDHPRERNILATAIQRCLKLQTLLAVFPYSASSVDVCGICSRRHTISMSLDCGHKFHPWCALNWYHCARMKRCPTCKHKISESCRNFVDLKTRGPTVPTIKDDEVNEEFHQRFTLQRTSMGWYPYHCMLQITSDKKYQYGIPARVALSLKYILLRCRRNIRKKNIRKTEIEKKLHTLHSLQIYNTVRSMTPLIFIQRFLCSTFGVPVTQVVDEVYFDDHQYEILLLFMTWWKLQRADFPREKFIPAENDADSIMTDSYIENYSPSESSASEVIEFQTVAEYCEQKVGHSGGWKNQLWAKFRLSIRHAEENFSEELDGLYNKLLKYTAGYSFAATFYRQDIRIYQPIPPILNNFLVFEDREVSLLHDLEDIIISNMRTALHSLYLQIDTDSETIGVMCLAEAQTFVNTAFQWTISSADMSQYADVDQFKIATYILHKILNREIR